MRSITKITRGRRVRLAIVALTLSLSGSFARAHDIPNAQIDRSIQVSLRPGRLTIDYEVSLAELTLVRDLRTLVDTIDAGDRDALFNRYGQVVGPLNAQGIQVAVDGEPVELRTLGFDLAVEEHPRYTFHFEADLPPKGRLLVRDSNFAGSAGTSRLAIRGLDGVNVQGDDLPGDVEKIPIRPVWQLSDTEERRTKRVVVTFSTRADGPRSASSPPTSPSAMPPVPVERRDGNRLSRLLDRAAGYSWLGLGLVAFGIGAAHAFQPGHGKTLVAASAVERHGGFRSALLALVITLTHTGSVLMVAAALWWTHSTRYGEIHLTLLRASGFVIAAIGLWRLGRHLAGFGEHEPVADVSPSRGGLIGLGFAGGLVPCWDAIGLVVVAEAAGRLSLGVALLLAFGLGMASVLVVVGVLASRLRRLWADSSAASRWERRVGIASGLVLTAMGLVFLGS